MRRILAHAHSTWSHDGRLALSAYPDVARGLGCAVVLLTEHEESGWDDARYAAYVRACRDVSTADVRLVPGLELLQDGFHVLAFGLQSLPPRPSSAADLAAHVHAQAAVLVLAHPAKYRWRIPSSILAAVDAIEIWNSKWIYDGVAGPHPDSVRLARGTRVIAGQDVHAPKHLSPLVLITEGDDVLRDLREGRYDIAWGEERWTIESVRAARGGLRARAYRLGIDRVLAAHRVVGRVLHGRPRADDGASPRVRPPRTPPSIAPMPMVSVILPVRNEEAYIARALASVLAQDYPADRLEILVADGRSTDATREIVRDYGAQTPGRLRLIDNPGLIVSTGLNAALAVATGDVIVRVDGHCEIARDFVRRVVAHLAYDDVECVGGVLHTIGERRRASIVAAAMSSPFGVGGSAFRAGATYSILTDTVAFPAFTRRAIARAGAFDETLVRNQDDEYSYRLRGLGGRILLATDVHARYYSRGTLRGLWRQAYGYGFWKVRVLQQHPRQMRLRQFVPAAFVASLVCAAALAAVLAASQRAWLLAPSVIAGTYLLAACAASVRVVRRGTAAARQARHAQSRLRRSHSASRHVARDAMSPAATPTGAVTPTRAALLLWLPVTFATLHVAYGLGSLVGLAAFRRQWRAPYAAAADPAIRTGGTHDNGPLLPPRHS